jgi:replication initiator protein
MCLHPPMGAVHEILELRGRQAALAEWWDRREAEAAAAYMADENRDIGCLYSGFCQAGLPHKRLGNAEPWQITSEHITLIVEPGSRPGAVKAEPVGVPYGSRARLIMLYLQSEALRTGSREVELGRSMRDWLTRMGVPIGGKSLLMVRDQAERITRCRLSFTIRTNQKSELLNQSIVDKALFLDNDDGKQASLSLEVAKLSEGFFEALLKHSVPLEDAAIRAISNNSQALDIYAWLAFRLHVLGAPTPISWAALKGQFGTTVGTLRHFRFRFEENLRLAMAVYPKAKVVPTERGLTLFPSLPPVALKVSGARVHALISR